MLASPGTQPFHINFRMNLSTPTKVFARILAEILLNLQINLRRKRIFPVLIIPIYEHEVLYYLFRSCSISFITTL